MFEGVKQIFRNLKNYQAIVYLDRDGTINKDVGYPHASDQLQILPTVARGIAKLNRLKIAVVIVTNQPTVAHSYASIQDIKKINSFLVEKLAQKKAYIDGIYSCPHHPEGSNKKYSIFCSCRKPGISMFLESQKDYAITKILGVMGDSFRDVEFGKKINARTVLFPKKDYVAKNKLSPDFIEEKFINGVNDLIESI